MKTDYTLWVLEDDDDIRGMYKEALSLRYKLRGFREIENFISQLKEAQTLPDMALVDLKLSDDEHFVDILRKNETRQLLEKIPFIVISGNDDIDIIRYCFEEGAYDYLTKPVSLNALLVKIERFFQEEGSPKHEYEEIVDKFNLTRVEAKIIKTLLSSDNSSLHRDDIYQNIWRKKSVHPKTLDVHLYKLRKKIEKSPYSLVSKGKGYFKLIKN